MITLSYEIEINAYAEKIWEVLWNKDTYTDWTQYFAPDCTYESDWEIGGKTFFTDGSGKNGMVSTIDSINPPFEVVFKHLGMLKNGEEVFNTKEIAEWSGSQEKYFLTEFHGYTKLQGEVQTIQEYEHHMSEGFRKGFERVKELAER